MAPLEYLKSVRRVRVRIAPFFFLVREKGVERRALFLSGEGGTIGRVLWFNRVIGEKNGKTRKGIEA
jgi:hypothetical protein